MLAGSLHEGLHRGQSMTNPQQNTTMNDWICVLDHSPNRPPYDGDCLGGTPKKSCPILSRYWRTREMSQRKRGEEWWTVNTLGTRIPSFQTIYGWSKITGVQEMVQTVHFQLKTHNALLMEIMSSVFFSITHLIIHGIPLQGRLILLT